MIGTTVADLHIHGCYSRGCSKDLTIALLEKYARLKGVNLLGTGDFTHPKWLAHIKQELKENDTGFLVSKTGFNFMWTTEISLIYTQGKGRRIHNLVFAPNGEVAQQITQYLGTRGRLDYDGRPIFKIPCPEFTEQLMSIDPRIEIIPAHAWTPWFSVFGSKSGFNSLKECFLDQTKHIHAIETGMSSDPSMNWRLSQLDNTTLVSFSDAHSFWPWRMGREATVFDGDVQALSYDTIITAIRTKKGLASTIEVDPNYGKYHIDGHRACGIVSIPQQTKQWNGICPKCHSPLTMGVLGRIEELADRSIGYTPKNPVPFVKLLPLHEIIAAIIGCGISSQKVDKVYFALIKNSTEIDVLTITPFEQLVPLCGEHVARAILAVRNGQVSIDAGYDGIYGAIHFPGIKDIVPEDEESKVQRPTKETKKNKLQKSLGDF